MNIIDSFGSYQPLWQRFIVAFNRQRLFHATLIIAPIDQQLMQLCHQMATMLLCLHQTRCGLCQSCVLISQGTHPDSHLLIPEKTGGAIKIDGVRHLYDTLTIHPKLGDKRLIIVTPADNLNQAAANALLKLLEEPTDNTYFILLAKHKSALLPTLKSRCQVWYLPAATLVDIASNELCLTIIFDLEQMLAFKVAINVVAVNWTAYNFNELIDALYLVTAQLISFHFYLPAEHAKNAIDVKLAQLSGQFKISELYFQLDTLTRIIRYLDHTVSINPLLALENFLLSYF